MDYLRVMILVDIKKSCHTGTEDDGLIAVSPLIDMQAIKDL